MKKLSVYWSRFTATAGNRQDVSYVIVQKELTHYKKYIWDSFLALAQKTMEKECEDKEINQHYAPLLANICEHYQREPKRKDKLFFQAPAMVLVLADTPIDGALASSTMELMANAQGLGVLFSGFIVKAIQNSQEIKRKLKITDTKQCISCMLIGYPKVTYRRTVPRKVVEALWI